MRRLRRRGTVAVPLGTGATDFCLEPRSVSVNTGKWTISSLETVKGEELGLPPSVYASITFQCRDQADYGIDYSLVLSLVGIVNYTVGTFVYAVQEMSGTSPDDLTPKTGQHAISKQDAIFTLSNFLATSADRPTVPGTAFTNGQPLRLSWESNGTWFQLYTKGDPVPIYASPATSFSLPGGLSADAQFVLVASVSGNPIQDSPSSGYQPIYLYDALTLVVANPDLTPRTVTAESSIATTGAINAGTLSVSGKTTAVGGLDVGTATAETIASIYGKLGISGSISIAGNSVSGPAIVNTNLDVKGKSTLGKVTSTTLGANVVNVNTVAAGNIGATGISAGAINATGAGNSLAVTGGDGQLWIDTGNRNVEQVFNTSGQFPTGWFQNRAGRIGNWVTGVVGYVAQGSDTGLYTNGRIGTAGGMAMLTHLPTRNGHRLMTSPLVPEAELHISDSARLIDGRAEVTFDETTADLVHLTAHAPYKQGYTERLVGADL